VEGYVSISARELKQVSEVAIKNVVDYDGSQDVFSTHEEFRLKSMSTVSITYRNPPPWAVHKKTTLSILKDLVNTAENVIEDENLKEKTVFLSILSHKSLYQVYSKSLDFNIYHFRDY
jgi:hypothetical protein